jgi:hypothetical protein
MTLYITGSSVGKDASISQDVARQVCVYGETKVAEKGERYWPIVAGLPLLTTTEKANDSEVIPLQISRIEAEASAAQPREVVEGVVDDVEGDDALVRLYYGGRENSFVFSASELKDVGAGYPGAVFGISVKPDYSYAIVHLQEREQAIRAEAPAPDLSFLEE